MCKFNENPTSNTENLSLKQEKKLTDRHTADKNYWYMP